MSKRKPGRFRGDRWFQRKVEERMRKEMRNLQSCEKLLAGSIASLRGTAWYEKEFCRQAELFREERNSQAAQRTALKRTASLKAKIENDTLLARDKTWAAEHTDDSDAQLLDYLHRCAANLGHTPLRREVLGSTYIAERFGSWAFALTIAKLPLPKSIKPPKETTINAYLKQQKINKPVD